VTRQGGGSLARAKDANSRKKEIAGRRGVQREEGVKGNESRGRNSTKKLKRIASKDEGLEAIET